MKHLLLACLLSGCAGTGSTNHCPLSSMPSDGTGNASVALAGISAQLCNPLPKLN